ncbi:hypothetical protein N7494_003976 [Penicillium frequentans]|uniref:FAD-binding domain-containing protein n=1 Tax=Penicillium frequentans TaxID=3151616 RepID=A0AAD6GI01_9EURO|nr:hypothetical protein N7494_003976 [Penicillium glabrum]
MSQLEVLIVGASIAGPTAAYWFAKAGANVTVIERFPALRTNGHNIDIRVAGVTVMRKMPGMEAAVRANKADIEGISFVDAKGRAYGTIKPTGNPDKQSLVSEYEIARGDLSRILYDMTKDNENINYVFGEQVASIQQGPTEDGPVTVEFTGSLPTAQFDLVVACDGATSRTRSIGLGCGSRDHIVSTNSWISFFSTDQDLGQRTKIGEAHSAVGGRFMAVGADAAGGSRISFMGCNPRSDMESILPFRKAMQKGEDAVKDYICQLYQGVGWKANMALKCMLMSNDFYATELVQVKLPTLSKGRFVLVGDAGYAPGPTGTGTTLAIVGAYLLAGEVCKHKGNLDAALGGYEAQMRPLINDLQKIPPLIPTLLAPQSAWGLWLRNQIFAFICWTRVFEIVEMFSGSASASSDEFPLADYEWVA